jgi:phosphoribosylformylglycinamidine synthase
MFNDFKGFDADGRPLKISVPPTLLVSSIAKVDDVRTCVDVQAMQVGDLVYVVGSTRDELGGSEYLGMQTGREAVSPGAMGILPKVDPVPFIALYRALHEAIRKGLVCSCASCGRGGIGVALARTAMAGELGIVGDLGSAGAVGMTRNDSILFSESQGRFVVTVAPSSKDEFEMTMTAAVPIQQIGVVSDGGRLILGGVRGGTPVDVEVAALKRAYLGTLEW